MNIQPVTKGPNTKRQMGLRIKKAIITFLYQSGAAPRKFNNIAWGTLLTILLLFRKFMPWGRTSQQGDYICAFQALLSMHSLGAYLNRPKSYIT